MDDPERSERGSSVKCYEVTQCGEKERDACYVWNSFRSNPADLENIQCWVLKHVFQQENQELIKKCLNCRYYLLIKQDTGIASDFESDVASINCEGTINNEKVRALGEIWEKLKQSNKNTVLLNLSKVNNIYSSGLGMIAKIHKEAHDKNGILIVLGAQGYAMTIFESTKMSKILAMVPDSRAARELLDKRKEAAKPPAPPPPSKKRPPCWEYWKNHNPRNATLCDECFRKINPGKDPCWMVEGVIEGVSFQYVNEDCQDCDYFGEFGKSG
jgi:anti-anti-sigma factor